MIPEGQWDGLGLQISSDFYFWVIVMALLMMISGNLYFCVVVIAVISV